MDNKEKLLRIKNDLMLFSENFLFVRPKAGGDLIPMIFNPVQLYVHGKIEEQKATTGKVRALVLKARQQGISTYTAARFYHKASMNRGVNVFIMAHMLDSSQALFAMAESFHSNNVLAPETSVSNAKTLEFPKLNSTYNVATAGQVAGGRGRTITNYHGSEVAFWANASSHFASSIQAVPDLPGTEIILESTANGQSGEFYERWQDATAGVGEYIPIFCPWFLLPEYSRSDLVDEKFTLDKEKGEDGFSEFEIKEMYNLNNAQIAWRRNKKAEIRDPRLFMQEYPANPEESFQSVENNSYILPSSVLRARKNKTAVAGGPLIMGVDPAGPGADRFAVVFRQGYVCTQILFRKKISTLEATVWLSELITEHQPDVVFLDSGGYGSAVLAHLRSMKREFLGLVRGVNFGGKSEFKMGSPNVAGPKHRRTEMWIRAKEWFDSEVQVRVPDNPAFQQDLVGPQMTSTVTNDLVLESKKDMRLRGIKSTDLADAFVLTFASLFIDHRSYKPETTVDKDDYFAKILKGRRAYDKGWMV